jgi:hypothetical protein
MPLYRFWGNRITTILENLMLGARFSEMHSGLRAYTRDCLLSVPFLSYSDDFVFDTQMMADAVTTGQRVVEVPIITRYTEESSSIGIGRSLRYVFGGLGWCARRRRERGKRGSKWLDAASPSRDAASAEALARATLGAVDGFVLPGRQMNAAGPDERMFIGRATKAGWTASTGPADLLVITNGNVDAVDPSSLAREALVVLWLDPSSDRRRAARALEEVGVRIVDLVAVGGSALMIARALPSA